MRPRGAAAAALLGAVLACRGAETPNTIRIAHEADVISLDPAAVAESATQSILSNVYESLVAFDRDMRLVPALAKTWNTLDEHTWLVELLPGVRFHDGALLTAADVKASLDRARTDPRSGVAGRLATVRDVEVVSDLSLRIRTVRPDALLINRLTYILVARNPLSGRPAGTGRYRLLHWERGRMLDVEAFSGHRDGPPPIPRAVFVPVREGEDSIRALADGTVDVLRPLPETLTGRLASLPGVRMVSGPGLTTYYLWFNSEGKPGRNPFADRRVRQAVSLALDRGAIAARLQGNGVPAHQIVQKGVFGFVARLPELSHDPSRARGLIAAAGFGKGFDVTLVHRPSSSLSAAAEAVRDLLGAVGIRVTLASPEWPEIVAGWRAARIPFFLAAWRYETGDASSFLRDCLMTRDTARSTGGYNPGFSDPELDRLTVESDQIFREKDRLKHYERIMESALEELPVVPLFHRHNLYGVSTRVRWEPRLDGKLLAAEMAFE